MKNRKGNSRAGDIRNGVTLVEMLLVLVIIAMMGSLSWLAIKPMIAHQRLLTATDTVHSELCRGRVDAMKSGHTYTFRYIVHGDHFHLGPDSDSTPPTPAPGNAANNNSPLPQVTVTPNDGNENADGDPLPPAEDGELPTGVEFVSDASDEVSADASGGGGDNWSDPIYFYPDGSTSDAKVTLNGQHQSPMQLSLRGVTGTVTMGDAKAATP